MLSQKWFISSQLFLDQFPVCDVIWCHWCRHHEEHHFLASYSTVVVNKDHQHQLQFHSRFPSQPAFARYPLVFFLHFWEIIFLGGKVAQVFTCPSVRSLVVFEERLRPLDDLSWLGSVLRVSFGALTLLVGWQEGHLTRKRRCHLSPRVFLAGARWRKKLGDLLSGKPGNVRNMMAVRKMSWNWPEVRDVLREENILSGKPVYCWLHVWGYFSRLLWVFRRLF